MIKNRKFNWEIEDIVFLDEDKKSFVAIISPKKKKSLSEVILEKSIKEIL